MSASSRSRLGNGGGYRRPALDVLDNLTDPGTRGTPDSAETWGVKDNSVSRGPLGTSEPDGALDTSMSLDTSSSLDTSDVSVALPVAKKIAEPRDHLKVSRPIADEMRDAVWFFSEHGRPRVQLGELLDEALRTWLERMKAEHNGGEAFPRRGKLR